MVISKDLIKSILEGYIWDKDIHQDGKFQCGFDELVEDITRELNVVVDTERSLRDITAEEQTLLEEYNSKCNALKVARRDIVSQCQHHSTTDQTDSLTTCDICGAEVARNG